MWRWYRLKQVLQEEDGIGVVEVILILVVLIGLVLIFKSQLTSLVETIFEKITSESSGIKEDRMMVSGANKGEVTAYLGLILFCLYHLSGALWKVPPYRWQKITGVRI